MQLIGPSISCLIDLCHPCLRRAAAAASAAVRV